MHVRRHNCKGKRELPKATQWCTSGKKCRPEWMPEGNNLGRIKKSKGTEHLRQLDEASFANNKVV